LLVPQARSLARSLGGCSLWQEGSRARARAREGESEGEGEGVDVRGYEGGVCLSGLCVCVPVCLPFLVWLGLGWVGMGLVVVWLVWSSLAGSDAKQGSCRLKCPWMGADWATI
jgi:hypothetical protein